MLRDYEAFLIKEGTIKSQSVPFYLKWVSDCYAFLNTTATYISHPPPDLPLERGGIGKTPMKVGKTNKISPMQGKNPIKSPPLQGEG